MSDEERDPQEKDPETHRDETPDGGGAGDAGSEGGEGRRNAERTPKLDEGGEEGQTEHRAPADDVGVPSDEEISEEEN